MSDDGEVIRPILFVIRLMQWMAAVVVMGLTAWAVVHLDGYRVVFTLVISVLTVVFYIPALFLACMKRNRGYMLPVDIIFYALWLAAFIFLAQTNDGCRWFVWGNSRACSRKNAAEAFTFLALFWTLCGMCLEIMNFYYSGEEINRADLQRHSEKQPLPQSSSVPAPVPQATNGDQTAV